MMRHIRVVVSLLALARLMPAAELKVEPFTLTTFDRQEHPAELGRLEVRENRSSASSKRITVAFVRLRSSNPQPGSPIVFLAGGPGIPGSVMARVPVYYSLFAELQKQADVILLDQRGTGMSEPNLECKRTGPFPKDAYATERAALAALQSVVQDCVAAARTQGIDVPAYNSDENAEDLEDLRVAFGVEKLDLIGFSYGTKLAANFIQRHPQSIGRVVFAAMHGPDHGLRLPLVLDLQLKRITALLGDSPYAGTDLYAQTKAAMQRLEKTPAALTITDRRTKKPVELSVGKVALQAILQAKLGNGRALPVVPALITTTAQGDYALLTGEVEGLYNSMAAGVSSMTMASICADGASPWRRLREQSEAAQSLFGDVPNLQLRPEVCRLAGQRGGNPATHGVVSSTAPALFLSGTLDSNGGPVQAEEIRWGFPNSVHIIIDNAAHETLPSAEVQQMVAAFFRGEDLRGRNLRFDAPKFLGVEQVKSGGQPRP